MTWNKYADKNFSLSWSESSNRAGKGLKIKMRVSLEQAHPPLLLHAFPLFFEPLILVLHKLPTTAPTWHMCNYVFTFYGLSLSSTFRSLTTLNFLGLGIYHLHLKEQTPCHTVYQAWWSVAGMLLDPNYSSLGPFKILQLFHYFWSLPNAKVLTLSYMSYTSNRYHKSSYQKLLPIGTAPQHC